MKRSIAPLFATLLLLTAGSPSLLAAEETRNLDPFSGIGIGISADVYYVSGDSHEITIQGNDKDVKDLITEVKDGFLKLKYDNWKVKRSKLTIYITSQDLDKVSMSGSGNFKTEKPVNAEEMMLAVSGSGMIHFAELSAEEVDVKISGSGNVVLEKGQAEELDIKISGSGKLQAERFTVEEFSAAISGSGGCKITVEEELSARISGSGSIYYHGSPQMDVSSSGSGKVKSL